MFAQTWSGRAVDPQNFDEEEQKLVSELRPPDRIKTLGIEDIPEELVWPFIEWDGSRGKLVFAQAAEHFDTWNVRHLVAFAVEMPLRRLD